MFNEEAPLSGFGEMILRESLILTGETAKGINLIKPKFLSLVVAQLGQDP